MKRGGPSCEVPKDVISSLPENVLSQIMVCLPLRDAARATVLSKTWRYTWLSLPKLTFDAKFLEDALKDKRFNASEINALVNLEKLQLNRCKLDVPCSFQGFRNLLNLELDNMSFLGDSFRCLVDCCPQLETLTLLKWGGCNTVSIHAPKIKHFTLSGKFESVLLRSPLNPVSLSLTLDEMVQNYYISRLHELIRLLSESSKLEKLSVAGYICKRLTSDGVVSMLPFKYKCLEILQLSNIEANVLNEFRWVVGMIRSCPVVQVLKISFSSAISAEHEIDNTMCCSFDHLREVEVAGVKGFSMELKLIGFLLNHSQT